MRRPCRHSFHSSSEKAVRTGRPVQLQQHYSCCRFSFSPFCCASICCAASPSEPCANETRSHSAAPLAVTSQLPRGCFDGTDRLRYGDACAAVFLGSLHLVLSGHSGGCA